MGRRRKSSAELLFLCPCSRMNLTFRIYPPCMSRLVHGMCLRVFQLPFATFILVRLALCSPIGLFETCVCAKFLPQCKISHQAQKIQRVNLMTVCVVYYIAVEMTSRQIGQIVVGSVYRIVYIVLCWCVLSSPFVLVPFDKKLMKMYT